MPQNLIDKNYPNGWEIEREYEGTLECHFLLYCVEQKADKLEIELRIGSPEHLEVGKQYNLKILFISDQYSKYNSFSHEIIWSLQNDELGYTLGQSFDRIATQIIDFPMISGGTGSIYI